MTEAHPTMHEHHQERSFKPREQSPPVSFPVQALTASRLNLTLGVPTQTLG